MSTEKIVANKGYILAEGYRPAPGARLIVAKLPLFSQ